MKILKYIINEKKIPVLFSTEIIHNEVLLKGRSAGFLILRYDKIKNKFLAICYGESTSLEIKNASEDAGLIENYLNNQFFSIIEK